MVFVYIALLLIAAAVLFLTEHVRVKFLFYLDRFGIGMTITCLYPFLQIFVRTEDEKPYLLVYVFKIRVLKKMLTAKKRKTYSVMDIVRSAKPADIRITARYAMINPFRTGILSGILGAALKVFLLENMQIEPDFTAAEDYVHVEGSAKIHVGHMLKGWWKHKNSRIKGGTVQWSKT